MKLWSSAVVNCPKGRRGEFLLRACCCVIVVSAFAAGVALAQSAPTEPSKPVSPASQEASANVPEVSTQEEIQTFQVKVNLVDVRVVVRDAQGKPVGNLKQDDFLIFDDNKPQTISKFSVLNLGASEAPVAPAPGVGAQGAESSDESLKVRGPVHRIAYLFDDINSSANDLVQARNAVDKRVKSLQPGESLAIFTISGQGTQDFTSDQDRLRAALAQLKPRPPSVGLVGDCPPIDYYLANQVAAYHDPQAFEVVLQEVIGCMYDGNTNPSLLSVQEAATREAADRVLRAGETQLQVTLHTLGDVIRIVRMLPGQHTIVFLTPGFIVAQQQAQLTDILDRAIRAGVVINTLDVKGVFTESPTGTDISQKAYGTTVFGPAMLRYKAASDLAQADSIMQIANATGGTFFHNNNDLTAGVDRLGAPPPFTYLLAFSHQGLKSDGKFHVIKVELKQSKGLTLQARKGYYAPMAGNSSEEAQQEITDEVFAQNEVQELPLRTQTQYYLGGDDKAHINVVVRVDVKRMAFKKSEGRNLNDLTVVTALFDRNANFISAKSNTVKMHIKDETLATKLNSGITLKSNFDVSPGSYVIRVVARDGQGKLSAQNSPIEIP